MEPFGALVTRHPSHFASQAGAGVKRVPIAIQRRSGIPLYIQVKDQVEKLIRLGIWEKGRKLPTERQLATALGVSRNTVSAAYRELEREGVVLARQGSGTFVCEAGYADEDRSHRLGRMIDLVLDEALDMGLGPDEFLNVARTRAEERQRLMLRLRVAFVECNREQLDYFSKELQLGSGVGIVPVLLDDLRGKREEVRRAAGGIDLVVTTLFHLDEVRGFFPDVQVLGIALDPDMETMVRIARLPSRRRVGLVCLSVDFADRVRKSIANAGINHLDFAVTTSRDEEQLQRFLAGVQVAIASPGRRREVERLVAAGTEVIEFVYRPDAGSISMLRSALLDRRHRPASDAVAT